MNNTFIPKFHFLSDHTMCKCPFWSGKTIVHAPFMAHHLVGKWGSSFTTAPLDSVGTDLVASFETFPISDSRFGSCNPHTSQILCFPLTLPFCFLGRMILVNVNFTLKQPGRNTIKMIGHLDRVFQRWWAILAGLFAQNRPFSVFIGQWPMPIWNTASGCHFYCYTTTSTRVAKSINYRPHDL